MLFLTRDDILESHQFLIDSYGGSQGIRDPELLESAMAQPQAGFGGQSLPKDPCEIAAT